MAMLRLSSPMALLTALLFAGSALTGCLSMGDDPVEPQPLANNNSTDQGGSDDFVNPDGSKSAAANETNKTVVGKGGIEHVHDYWGGETKKVIYDADVYLTGPIFCDERDTNKFGCQVIQLPVTDPATLVYEGASKVIVTVSNFQPWVMGLEVKYKNGANPAWGSAITLADGTPAEIPVSAVETDMPHSSASQWAWKFIGNRAPGPEALWVPGDLNSFPDFHLTIEVVKGDKIVDWPGHPDFYANKEYRVVMDKAATTKVGGITDGILYGDEANIVRPDLLVSSGTGKIVVYLNVTEVRAQTGNVKPDSFFIEYTNATGYWEGDYDESGFGNNRVFGNMTEAGKYVMEIPVKHTGWDSPYAPVSGWQFLVRSSYSDPTGGGWCPGCLPYEVDFHMTVIAYPDPQYAGGDALEA